MVEKESRRSFFERVSKGTAGLFAAGAGGAVGALTAKAITEKSALHSKDVIDEQAIKAVEEMALKKTLTPREIVELYLQQIKRDVALEPKQRT